MSLPALRALREMKPRAHISVLTHRSIESLYRTVPPIDETIPYPREDRGAARGWVDVVSDLRRRRFDAAIIFPRSFSSALTIFSARVPRRIGYRGDGRSALLTDPIDREERLLRAHRIHYYHHLLEALGSPPPPSAPRIEILPDADTWAAERLPAGRPLIGLNPGATYGSAKQWFPERFIEVGRRTARRLGARLVVIGGRSEAELAQRVAAGIGSNSISLAGKTDLPQLAAVLHRCDLLVTNDTGPMHVADAVGTPTVAIFGPTDWVTTPPFGRRHLIVRKEIECSPCLKRTCPLGHHHCMKWISPDDVTEAIERIMERRRP